MHVNEKTGEISSPDEIIKRARELDAQVSKLDEAIEEQREALKELKASRDKLLRELRAVVRPVPLFDAQPARSIYDNTTVSITGPDGKTHDVTDAMKSIEKKRH